MCNRAGMHIIIVLVERKYCQPCTFSIPRSVLPVRGNALESHKKRRRTERPAPPPVVKGRGYRRKKDGGQSVNISSLCI